MSRPRRSSRCGRWGREAGLTVTAASHDVWWQQLFPNGFGSYARVNEFDDVFAVGPIGQLALFHPLDVDEMGHAYGAASAQYRAAAEKIDGQLQALIDRLDLKRDTVIVTADHGHSDRGGHGGRQPEIAQVLTCFAGLGVARSPGEGRFDARSIAPALAVFRGLRFPKHLRAGDDDLDSLWQLIDAAAFSPAYLADRRAAVARVRSENLAQLQQWGFQSWPELYAHEQRKQQLVLALSALTVLLLLYATRRSHGGWVWLVAVAAASVGAFVAARGSFDGTAINQGDLFVRVAIACCFSVLVVASLLHRLVGRNQTAWLRAQSALVFVALAANLAHIAAYGWPLHFPLPGPVAFFFPFFGGLFAVVQGGALAFVALLRVATRR